MLLNIEVKFAFLATFSTEKFLFLPIFPHWLLSSLYLYKEPGIWMFAAALFIIVKS